MEYRIPPGTEAVEKLEDFIVVNRLAPNTRIPSESRKEESKHGWSRFNGSRTSTAGIYFGKKDYFCKKS